MVQLDFFKTEQECEIDALKAEVLRLRTSTEKVRKGMYSRLNQVEKMYIDLHAEFEGWKRVVCRGKSDILVNEIKR